MCGFKSRLAHVTDEALEGHLVLDDVGRTLELGGTHDLEAELLAHVGEDGPQLTDLVVVAGGQDDPGHRLR